MHVKLDPAGTHVEGLQRLMVVLPFGMQKEPGATFVCTAPLLARHVSTVQGLPSFTVAISLHVTTPVLPLHAPVTHLSFAFESG